MLYRVEQGFEDVKTGVYHSPGEVLSAEEPRIQEFLLAGVVVDDDASTDSFDDMTLVELRAELTAKGREYSGKAKKQDLIKLLREAE